MCRRYGNPLTGAPTLPCAGAPGEQPAALIDAFAVLDMEQKPEND